MDGGGGGGGAAGAGSDDEGGAPARLTLSNIRTLTTLLEAIKTGSKQVCSVVLAPEGVGIHWEDESKTLRSSVQLRRELFGSYDLGGAERRTFGVSLSQLVDALAVFASAGPADLRLLYPGPNGELQLEMADAGDGADLAAGSLGAGGAGGGGGGTTLYARVATLEQEAPPDMSDYWSDPTSYFLSQGALLKEAVDDLEWPGSAVAIKLVRDPPAAVMSAHGTGSLEVHLNVPDLSGFSVGAPTVVQRYKYKNLKAALSHIPGARDVGGSISTKVSIDSNGLLKVTHMVPLGGRGGGGQGGGAAGRHHPPGSSFFQPSAMTAPFSETQAALDSSRVGVIQFVSLPVEEEE